MALSWKLFKENLSNLAYDNLCDTFTFLQVRWALIECQIHSTVGKVKIKVVVVVVEHTFELGLIVPYLYMANNLTALSNWRFVFMDTVDKYCFSVILETRHNNIFCQTLHIHTGFDDLHSPLMSKKSLKCVCFHFECQSTKRLLLLY